MRQRYGDDLFGRYGFLDAFNPTLRTAGIPLRHGRIVPGSTWIDGDYLGIDQGPIILMIENYRTELVWRYMRNNADVVRGHELMPDENVIAAVRQWHFTPVLVDGDPIETFFMLPLTIRVTL